jgi:hypothetical protein
MKPKELEWADSLRELLFTVSPERIAIGATFYELEDFINNLLTQQRTELLEEIKKMKKQKTANRQLYKYDGTIKQIKYFENDSDPAYNRALEDITNLLNKKDE